MLRVECKGCSAKYQVDEKLRGRKIRCRKCGAIFTVADEAAAGRRASPARRFTAPRRLKQKAHWTERPRILYAAGGGLAAAATLATIIALAWHRSAVAPGPEAPRVSAAGETNQERKVAAQRHAFDPSKDFEGYLECSLDDFCDLYDFGPFQEWIGKVLAAEKLQELRSIWAVERERVNGKKKEMERDPAAKYCYNFERLLRTHPFFSRITFSKHYEHLPFAFYIEKPKLEDPTYERRLIEAYLPWMQKLESVFKAKYVEPLHLVRKKESACYAVAILASEGTYRMDYAKAVKDPGLYSARAHYDSELCLAVTYEDNFASRNVDDEQRHTVLHEFVHALTHAHFKGHGEMPKPIWFTEGLAEYCAPERGGELESLEHPAIHTKHLKHVVQLLLHPQGRIYLSTLKDLVTANGPGYSMVDERAWLRAAALGPNAVFVPDETLWAFYAQSNLFVHFLHEAAGGRYKQPFLKYMEAVMAGKEGWETFTQSFAGIEPSSVEEEFFEYIREEHLKLLPGTPLPAKLPRLLPTPSNAALAARRGARGEATQGAEKKPTASRFDPEALGLKPDEWQAEMGAAVFLAGDGRVEEAMTRLRTFSALAKDAATSLRFGRELARLEDVQKLRNEYLKDAEKKQAFLEIGAEHGRVTKVDLDRGTIGMSTRNGEKELPLSRFNMESLRKVAKLEGSKSWIGAYLLLLNGRSREDVQRYPYLQSKDSTRAKELQTDMADDYAALRAVGEPASYLDSISQSSLPKDWRRAASVLEELKSFWSRHGRVEIVQRRKEPLRAYAERLLENAFDPSSKGCLGLNGKLETLGAGRIRLEYSFKDPAEENDFIGDADYLSESRKGFLGGNALPEIKTTVPFKVCNGTLEGVGATCCRLALPFTAPFKIRYNLSFGAPATREEQVVVMFLHGVCDDGKGNNIRCLTTAGAAGGFVVFDGQPLEWVKWQEFPLSPGQPYPFELEHGGKAVDFRSGKVHTQASHVGTLKGGSMFFWIHSSLPVRISKLEIEAQLDDALLGDVKKRWIEAQTSLLFR